ncbi:extradiol ring-cleavage dioxygenase [Streptomyces sp. NBC_00299]|uniref:extradiol ring-cleavage dioxygenase n=1 Tax=Streptomyces sp. NBC_00299 TaxID=2975705 RepID=UPI002E28327B|nr:extradiol ring-cleavage dioxygenase [Streptomyces sp. NBC_00299]
MTTYQGRDAPSVFGAVHLGYLVLETNRFADWRRFGTDAIGMHLDDLDTGLMRFRIDDHECRFLLRRGPAEDVVAIGWHLDDHTTFEQIEARVRAHGVPVAEGTAEEARLRGVERLLRFPGPKGITQEIYTTPVLSPEPLRMLASGWVTGDSGMGHVAITSTRPTVMRGYFNTVFDFSYYARTPSGFEWEVGWNPVVIDETTWQPTTHQGISIWGHTPVGRTIVDKLAQFRLGARSLAHPEHTVPGLSGTGPDD